ncbi:MAG: hypothetical protein ICV73_03710 [Acetobacteraceae bacterium]|nr:hypothetical protein [Acetobacteraceae bacterium]
MPKREGTRAATAATTHLVEVGPASANGALRDLAAGDRLGLRLAESGGASPRSAVVAAAKPGVEAVLPDGRCVGRIAPDTAARVAPLLAAGRPLAATVTAMVPRPTGGPPRVHLAIVKPRRAA